MNKLYEKIERAIRMYRQADGRCYLCGNPMGKDFAGLIEYYGDLLGISSENPEIFRSRKPDLSKKRRSKINIDIDHVIPRSKGGSNNWYNKALVHKSCNTMKSGLHPTEYLNYVLAQSISR